MPRGNSHAWKSQAARGRSARAACAAPTHGTDARSGEQRAHLSWGIKKAQRIWFKLNSKYGGDLSKVTDCARISIIFASAGALERAAKKVLERASTFKNRVAHPTDECYHDLMFTLPMSNGHVCEVQLHIAEMHEAKNNNRAFAGKEERLREELSLAADYADQWVKSAAGKFNTYYI